MRISDWSSDVGSSDLLLNCLSRILNPTYGAVEYDGHDLLGRPVHRLSEIGVTRTFQNLELFGEGTVLENVVVGCFPRFRSNKIGRASCRARVCSVRVDLGCSRIIQNKTY